MTFNLDRLCLYLLSPGCIYLIFLRNLSCGPRWFVQDSRNSHDLQTLQVKMVKSYGFTDILSGFHVYAFWILGSLLFTIIPLTQWYWIKYREPLKNTLLGTNMSQDGWQGEFFSLPQVGYVNFPEGLKLPRPKGFPGAIWFHTFLFS